MLIYLSVYRGAIYKFSYYKSNQFLALKSEVSNFVSECNELNEYIETLKEKHNFSYTPNYAGSISVSNIGKWNYKRSRLANYNNKSNVYDCSLSVFKNAREQPYKYICKYFDITADEDTLTKYEDMLNDYSSVEQGLNILKTKQKELIEQHKVEIPFLLRKYDSVKLAERLDFDSINISKDYLKSYTFRYISAGGNSGQSFSVVLDVDTLANFIAFLSDKVKFKKSAKYQRQLMTPKLREQIKSRDNYTCCECGVSVYQEPHLLLEIDHIIPIAKGGLTEENNLQTLCWRCNRTKSSKITQ